MQEGWQLAVPDWVNRMSAGRSLVPDLPLFPTGEKAVAIYRKLRLADVPGTPTIWEANNEADGWMSPIVRALFGSLDPESKKRLIREVFALVPKKNSKTTDGALGLMLVGLLMNERPRAPFGMAAPVKDTADLAFNAIAGAIDLDPVLTKLFHTKHHVRTIVHRQTKAFLQVMAFDPEAVTGSRWAGFLLDESHEVASKSKAAAAMRQVRGGMVQYPEAYLAQITTQSEDPPTGIFKADLMRARAVRDGKKDFAVLPVLYEFPEEMQKDRTKPWRDPANWHMVTPNAGKSITIERLKEECVEAEEKGPDELRAWASQHLNVEVGLALHANRWAGAEQWEAQATHLPLLDLLRRSEVVTIGIDGGGLDDLLGLCVLGRDERTGHWLGWYHAWAHPIVLERHKQQAERFREFEKEGSMTIVGHIGEDVEQVAAIVKQCEDSGLLDNIGVDRAGIASIVSAIIATGIERDRIFGIPQGWELNGSIKAKERKLAEGTFHHDHTELMNWCVGNAIVEPHGNAISITKATSGSAKIDPLAAGFNAVALMAKDPEPRKKSFQMFVL